MSMSLGMFQTIQLTCEMKQVLKMELRQTFLCPACGYELAGTIIGMTICPNCKYHYFLPRYGERKAIQMAREDLEIDRKLKKPGN